jgi:hypothetical protein
VVVAVADAALFNVTHCNFPESFRHTQGFLTVPANVPASEHLPPGAFTHFSLLPTFSHTNGVVEVPDFNPTFVHLPPTDAEGCWANVGFEIAMTKRMDRQKALMDA